ncbi:hypothetical protein TNCV_1094381 [Trichonephila clavipes]|uniref:Uncharacterized protein n=1 Tax=Trichonephila clavipes TaxID=2585209 RepID=A0A8X6V3S4_TRICX|nr:hypothetical protein TNCV_1094381 [Trichonephila clavipes]
MYNGILNAEYTDCSPSNKVNTIAEDEVVSAVFYCVNTFSKAAPASLVAAGNENPDATLERKAIQTHSNNTQHSYGSF